MPDVIDLISSSPEHPEVSIGAKAHIPRTVSEIDAFRFDDVQDVDNFPEPKLVKKRRLTPTDGDDNVLPPPSSTKNPIELSDDNDVTLPVKPAKGKESNERSFSKILDLSDAIEFTSSAPEPRRRRKASVEILDLSSDLDLPDFNDLLALSQPVGGLKSNTVLSEKTSNLLSTLGDRSSKVSRSVKTKSTFRGVESISRKPKKAAVVEDIDDILNAPPGKPAASKNRNISKTAVAEKDAKSADRTASKAAKDAEKEAGKERKRLEREQKAEEKQRAASLAEVNRSKVDKKESTKEMIIDISSDLRGTSVGDQVEAFMQTMEVNLKYFEDDIDLCEGNQTILPGNIIKWRRKVDREYDEQLDHYKPIAQPRIEKEEKLLVRLTGVDFAAIAACNGDTVAHISETAMKANLDAHIHAMQRKYKNCQPIYMIEGLVAFLNKNKNAKNREYQAAARAVAVTANPEPLSQPSRKRKQKTSTPSLDLSFMTSDLMDNLLLHIQLTHPTLLIHHTTTPASSAHWIKLFTEHLSLRPTKLQMYAYNDAHAGFCMESGQVKTGDNAPEVFIRMLQELPRVTASMAHGIAEAGYPSLGRLVEGFKKVEMGEGRSEAKLMLEDVRKAVNRDGGVSERRLGPQVSRRLWRVLFGRDEGVTDV